MHVKPLSLKNIHTMFFSLYLRSLQEYCTSLASYPDTWREGEVDRSPAKTSTLKRSVLKTVCNNGSISRVA